MTEDDKKTTKRQFLTHSDPKNIKVLITLPNKVT